MAYSSSILRASASLSSPHSSAFGFLPSTQCRGNKQKRTFPRDQPIHKSLKHLLLPQCLKWDINGKARTQGKKAKAKTSSMLLYSQDHLVFTSLHNLKPHQGNARMILAQGITSPRVQSLLGFAPRIYRDKVPPHTWTKGKRKEMVLCGARQGLPLLPQARAPELDLTPKLVSEDVFWLLYSGGVVLLLSPRSDFKACLFVTLASAEMKAARKSGCSEWTGAGSYMCRFYPE